MRDPGGECVCFKDSLKWQCHDPVLNGTSTSNERTFATFSSVHTWSARQGRDFDAIMPKHHAEVDRDLIAAPMNPAPQHSNANSAVVLTQNHQYPDNPMHQMKRATIYSKASAGTQIPGTPMSISGCSIRSSEMHEQSTNPPHTFVFKKPNNWLFSQGRKKKKTTKSKKFSTHIPRNRQKTTLEKTSNSKVSAGDTAPIVTFKRIHPTFRDNREAFLIPKLTIKILRNRSLG
uniref:Uncharacterized protein n=1 Tax=Echinococcus granulosus TaxID=6210 RepID=A0A068WL51_ECHGR|nr:hypothetical protein EgrG_001119400 [Echinococcus granulosus]